MNEQIDLHGDVAQERIVRELDQPRVLANIVRINGKLFNATELGELYDAAMGVLRNVSPKARKDALGYQHYVRRSSLARLAAAAKETW
jgi:hypothetical protein